VVVLDVFYPSIVNREKEIIISKIKIKRKSSQQKEKYQYKCSIEGETETDTEREREIFKMNQSNRKYHYNEFSIGHTKS